MAVDPFVRNLCVEQRRRLVGGILTHAEKAEWWPLLTTEQRAAFRQKVLDSAGVYHDVMLDMLKAVPTDSLRNEQAYALLVDVHAAVARRGG